MVMDAMNVQILQGDCREVLAQIEPGTVQTCVTSPPYFALRDYGTARWIGGNDPECDHSQKRGGNGETSLKQVTSEGTQNYQFRGACGKCGALRVDEQIGIETTPEEYVSNLVTVFRAVWRVLRDDGTLWLNLGDSYAGSGGAGSWNKDRNGASRGARIGSKHGDSGHTSGVTPPPGLKAKDLVGIPWMVAFALRADGWYLRSEIIWYKRNPMPESATDRPTKAHEQIFLLSKSPRYYYDAAAIAEPVSESSKQRLSQDVENQRGSARANGGTREKRPMRAVYKNLQPDGQIPNSMHTRRAEGLPDEEYLTRNKRSVWDVTTKPYREAHFATFPPDLIEPCILAGSKPGDIVLDPFNGSGTTGEVSIKHNRSYIGCELNPEYVALTQRRLSKVQPVLYGAVNA
jgi:DNA modification methylase